jgi:hypothetical protein
LTRQQVAELQERRAHGVLINTVMNGYRPSNASVYRYLGEIDVFQSVKNT